MVKSKKKYIVFHVIHSIAIGIYSAICIQGILLLLWEDQLKNTLAIDSLYLLLIVIGLSYIIVRTGGEMDEMLKEIKK